MLDFLLELDESLLLAINGWNNAFFDDVMYWISDKWIWIPLYVALLYTLVRTRTPYQTLIAILLIPLLIAAADGFASGLCKPFFARFRPTHEPSLQGLVHVVHGEVSGLYGFISSHAANTCALALFLSLLFRYAPFTWMLFSWAALNCYSRMYMGVHYPGDILFGILAGLALGALFYGIYQGLVRWLAPQKKQDKCLSPSLVRWQLVLGSKITALVYGLTLAGILIIAIF